MALTLTTNPYFTMEQPQTLLEAGHNQPLVTQIDLLIQTLQGTCLLTPAAFCTGISNRIMCWSVEDEISVIRYFGLSVASEQAKNAVYRARSVSASPKSPGLPPVRPPICMRSAFWPCEAITPLPVTTVGTLLTRVLEEVDLLPLLKRTRSGAKAPSPDFIAAQRSNALRYAQPTA